MAEKKRRVKEFFTIPFTLNNSRGDAIFILFKRSISVRTISFVVIVMFANFGLKRAIPALSHGGIVRPIMFLIAIDILAWLLFATRIKTGLTGFKLFRIAKTHLLKFQGQSVTFDKTTPLSTVADYIPIKEILKDDTLVFEDGSKGRLIPIIGYASTNMFVSGKIETIDAFQNALRTADNDTTQFLLTVVSGQNVGNQVRTLMNSYEKETNQTIRQWYRDEIRKLTDYVDGQFDTLHQYILFKYPNEDALQGTLTWLQELMTSGSLTFAIQDIPKGDEVLEILRNIFSPSSLETTIVTFGDENNI